MFSVGFVLRLEEPNTGYIAQEQIKYIAGGPGRMFRGDPWGRVKVIAPEKDLQQPTEVSGQRSVLIPQPQLEDLRYIEYV